jgi:hypothetical protein
VQNYRSASRPVQSRKNDRQQNLVLAKFKGRAIHFAFTSGTSTTRKQRGYDPNRVFSHFIFFYDT